MNPVPNFSLSDLIDLRDVFVCAWLVAAGLFWAFMETLENPAKFDSSIFRKWRRDYWLKTESWVRKYARDVSGSPIIEGYDKKDRIVYRRKWLGLSATWLVGFTDGWHKAKGAVLICITAAICVAGETNFGSLWGWVWFFGLKALLSATFELFYGRLFRA